MNPFSQERGAEYVPAFAARLLLAMGKGIAVSPDEIKHAFDEDAEDMWILALIVARWYGSELGGVVGQTVAVLLPDPELLPMLSSLGALRGPLLPFAQVAHEAQSEPRLAAAGVYFSTAVQQIGIPLLSAAIKSGPVVQLAAKLRARFALPEEIRVAYERVIRGLPAGLADSRAPLQPPSAPVRPSRGERFERSDLGPRPRRAKVITQRTLEQPAALGGVSFVPTQPAELLPPEPQIAAAEVTRMYLLALKWKPDEVDRLLAGPVRRT